MNWLTLIWSFCGGACLTMAALHLLIALLGHQRKANILVGLIAIGACAITFEELHGLHTLSIEASRYSLHRAHFFLVLLLVPIPWYVQLNFGTGRRWLAWTASSLWIVALMVSLSQANSLTYSEISGIESLTTFWGEGYTRAIGVRNPLALIADLGTIAILIHVADASILLWKKGFRRRALISGGSIVLFFLFALIHIPLVDMGILRTPTFIGPSFMLVVAAVSAEIVFNVASASRLSKQIASNETRWRTLMERVNLMVIGIDLQGRINFINPHLSKVSGYTEDELLGRPFTMLAPPRDLQRIEALLKNATIGNIAPKEEIHLRTKSKLERIVDWSPALLHDESGRISGLISVGTDLTERHEIEQALQASRAKLEQAGRLNMLGELTATLAHELNQPLAAILANSQAARRFMEAESPDLDEIREIINDIIRDDKRASDVIQKLRSLIRHGESEVVRLNLNEIIRDTLKLCKSELGARKINCQLQLVSPDPYSRIGRVEIQQVILNLVANAMHALNTTESKQLIIETGSSEGFHSIKVRDNGCGIPDEHLQSIFSPLSTTRPDGLGMGLSICRRLLELHNGTISAKKSVESGAELTIILPAA